MKPGYKTTEFWAAAIVQAAGLATALGLITPIQGDAATFVAPQAGGLAAMAASAIAYTWCRTKVKTASKPPAPAKTKKKAKVAGVVAGACFWLLAGALMLAGQAWAGHPHLEKWYQAKWCAEQGGQVEVVLQDGSRCDCVTATNAVEFDFDIKWAESLGQAALYSALTGLRGGIVLIRVTPAADQHFERIRRVIKHFNLPIDLWEMEGDQ